MKFRIILIALGLLAAACSPNPPVTGTFTTKAGQFVVHPNGRFEVIVEPHTSK